MQTLKRQNRWTLNIVSVKSVGVGTHGGVRSPKFVSRNTAVFAKGWPALNVTLKATFCMAVKIIKTPKTTATTKSTKATPEIASKASAEATTTAAPSKICIEKGVVEASAGRSCRFLFFLVFFLAAVDKD